MIWNGQTPITLLVYILTVTWARRRARSSAASVGESVRRSWVCRLTMLKAVVYILFQIVNNNGRKCVIYTFYGAYKSHAFYGESNHYSIVQNIRPGSKFATSNSWKNSGRDDAYSRDRVRLVRTKQWGWTRSPERACLMNVTSRCIRVRARVRQVQRSRARDDIIKADDAVESSGKLLHWRRLTAAGRYRNSKSESRMSCMEGGLWG